MILQIIIMLYIAPAMLVIRYKPLLTNIIYFIKIEINYIYNIILIFYEKRLFCSK